MQKLGSKESFNFHVYNKSINHADSITTGSNCSFDWMKISGFLAFLDAFSTNEVPVFY